MIITAIHRVVNVVSTSAVHNRSFVCVILHLVSNNCLTCTYANDAFPVSAYSQLLIDRHTVNQQRRTPEFLSNLIKY